MFSHYLIADLILFSVSIYEAAGQSPRRFPLPAQIFSSCLNVHIPAVSLYLVRLSLHLTFIFRAIPLEGTRFFLKMHFWFFGFVFFFFKHSISY